MVFFKNANPFIFVFGNFQNNIFKNESSLQSSQETTQTPIVVMKVPEWAQPAYTSENIVSMPEESNIEKRQIYASTPLTCPCQTSLPTSRTEVAFVTLYLSPWWLSEAWLIEARRAVAPSHILQIKFPIYKLYLPKVGTLLLLRTG